MNRLNLENLETELKKRHHYPYKWFRKQNDEWDSCTNFIYQTPNWDTFVEKTAALVQKQKLDKHHIFQYAANRWYNFWSATAVEQIFTELQGVKPVAEAKDFEKDFYLFGIPFDHKTSVFPKQFDKSYEYALTHKTELIEWLFKNQSSQKRYHLKNRLFIVVYAENGDHWKLKGEISLIKIAIEKYVESYSRKHLHSFTFVENQITFSDIIWVSK